ncbi:glycoside hydrolase family 3 C-terminal domain-containing protein [Glaciecola sp. MH2013]|uniref:glycoside hydrolase family 3 N-terminal domain-containing protein n=1 Tax=Glaciecola sp. MH2013 TaxID=2785524 RepID=UPI00189ECF62|nr:glycoside hydrolase family 3 N-terminal domain-containing protein [Glaciecola sp. MH2013]MBF7073416.1 glycoside hydrolase family 3 C-terminal domain-containing protein [Glaciecola sp. MH2013]
MSYQRVNHTNEKQIEEVLATLSLEQKIGQLNLIPIEGEVTDEQRELIAQGKVGSVLKSNGAKQNKELQEIAVNNGVVPILFQEDVIHGYKTITPVPLAEAASWDLELIEQAAAVAAKEAAAAGIHLTYAPMVDISRDPRWGRILEGAGEDPYLGALISEKRVRGFQQANDKQEERVLATVKHFAGYGASLAGRDYNIQDISERELREIHLPPFQAAVDAGVSSVMLAYTAYDGTALTANQFLVQKVLKDELGFKGLIMTDWETIPNLLKIGAAENIREATQMAIENSVDMDMTSNAYIDNLAELVASGTVDEALIDESVRRVLRLKQQVGLLDAPFLYFDEAREKATLLSQESKDTALAIARKSMVLLENKAALLPLDKSDEKLKKVAVIGPFAKAQEDLNGWWFAMGKGEDTQNIFDAIAAECSGFDIEVTFSQGVSISKFDKVGEEFITEAVKTAAAADVAILVLGEEHWMSGEGGGTASLHLPGLQEQLVEAISASLTPVVSVIVSGRPYVLTNVASKSTALLQAWMPGTMGGKAVADILFGNYNPAGRLPVTFPYHQGQVPIFYNYKRTSHSFDAGEKDLRYTTTYRDVQSEPLYPFGYGLSYSEFVYSAPTLSATSMTKDGSIELSVTVENSSAVDGVETVQLYIRDEVSKVARPFMELKDFQQVTIPAGKSLTLSFTITAEKLAYIGPNLQSCVETGIFTVFAGPNSYLKGTSTNFTIEKPQEAYAAQFRFV